MTAPLARAASAVVRQVARIHPRMAVVVHDLAMVWVAWTACYFMRYSVWPDSPGLPLATTETAVVLGAQALVLWWTGLYRGLWRFASLPDLWNILRASVVGALLIFLALFLLKRAEGVPRSVFVLYPVALTLLLGLPRLAYRFWKDSRLGVHTPTYRQRVLVLGAGRAGDMLVRDLRRDGSYAPVGFLDDDPRLRGSKIQGIPVLGTVDRLPYIADEAAAEGIIIAMPSANNAQMQRVVELCEQTGLPFRTLPRLQDLQSAYPSYNQLKEVRIEDLLGREPVSLDWAAIGEGLAGKSALVTGGGGSIGSELCRQIARLGPVELVIVESSELNLFSIENELRRQHPGLALHAVLGDCCDEAAMDHTLGRFRPDIVFHAAAYKHVPLLQGYVREAVRNNVLGTRYVARAAHRHGVGSFVLISTDKAVNPTNVMGASKRAAEILCQTFAAHSSTRFLTVRFGNVLASAGSVVPLFQEQIAAGGPVTVTHPEVSRYFMTIAEACQLILQAAVLGGGGEIFVLDMGRPVKIRYLAEQMIRLANKVPDEDVAIVFTGLRPGEKLHEELFHEHESYCTTEHSKILLAQQRALDWALLDHCLTSLEQACRNYDETRLHELLGQLVPELDDGAAAEPSGPEPDVVTLNRASP